MDLQQKSVRKMLESLLEATKALCDASSGDDISEIGRRLDERQKVIDEMKVAGDVFKLHTTEIQSLIDEILSFDKKACSSIEQKSQELGREYSQYKQKAAGLLKYNYSKYNLMSGQMLDNRK